MNAAFYLSWWNDAAGPMNEKPNRDTGPEDLATAAEFLQISDLVSREQFAQLPGLRFCTIDSARVFFSTSFVCYEGKRGNWNAPNMPTFSDWGCDSLDVLALRESNLFKCGANPNSFFR